MRQGLILLLLIVLFPSLSGASELDAAFRAALAGDPGGGGASEESLEEGGTSKSKALLLSLLLPGLGQHQNGDKIKSRIFFGVDAAIWASFIVFKSQESLRTDDFQEYAEHFAGVEGIHDEEYYRILTIYDDSDDYNTGVRIDARSIHRSSISDQHAYFDENKYGEDRAYRWKTNRHRLEYRVIRNDARNAGQNADFALVAALLNRCIAAIEAARSAGRFESVAAVAEHIEIIPPRPGDEPALRIAVRTGF